MAEMQVAENKVLYGQTIWDFAAKTVTFDTIKQKLTQYRARKNFWKRLRIALFTRQKLLCLPCFRRNQYTLGFHFLFKLKSKKKRKVQKIVLPNAKRPKKADTLCAISVTTAQDCCICVKVLFHYFAEIWRMLTCIASHGQMPSTNFNALFCQLGDATVRLFKDLYTFLKFIYKKYRKCCKKACK